VRWTAMATVVILVLEVWLVIEEEKTEKADQVYNILIQRDFTTPEEGRAIEVAEALDLVTILNTSRFVNWPKRRGGTNDAVEALRLNYYPAMIDTEVIRYSSMWIWDLEDQHAEGHFRFNYLCKCERPDTIIANGSGHGLALWSVDGNTSHRLIVGKTATVFEEFWETGNDSRTISSPYVVEQTIVLDVSIGFMEAWGILIFQTIILDGDYRLVALLSPDKELYMA